MENIVAEAVHSAGTDPWGVGMVHLASVREVDSNVALAGRAPNSRRKPLVGAACRTKHPTIEPRMRAARQYAGLAVSY
jgi:hypothetical protein